MSEDPDERIRRVRRALLLDRIRECQQAVRTAPTRQRVLAWIDLLTAVEREIKEKHNAKHT